MAKDGQEISPAEATVPGSEVVAAEAVFSKRIAGSAFAAAIFWLVALVTSAQAGANADNYLSSLVGLEDRMGPAALAASARSAPRAA